MGANPAYSLPLAAGFNFFICHRVPRSGFYIPRTRILLALCPRLACLSPSSQSLCRARPSPSCVFSLRHQYCPVSLSRARLPSLSPASTVPPRSYALLIPFTTSTATACPLRTGFAQRCKYTPSSDLTLCASSTIDLCVHNILKSYYLLPLLHHPILCLRNQRHPSLSHNTQTPEEHCPACKRPDSIFFSNSAPAKPDHRNTFSAVYGPGFCDAICPSPGDGPDERAE